MALVLTQTDTAADCGAVAGCSGATVAGSAVGREATSGGTAGSTEQTITITKNSTEAGFMFQSADNEPNKTSWEAGDWVVRLNVTTSQMNITWEDTYVCRFDNACGSLATVGSLTGQAISCGSTGVKSMTVSGASQTANATDEIYIVLVFKNANTHGNKSIGITPDQNIDTPLDVATTFFKTIAATAVGAAAVKKGMFHTIQVTATGVALVDPTTIFPRTVAVTATGLASIAKTVKKTISVAAVGVAGLAKTVGKIIAVTAVGTPSLIKNVGKTISVVATGAPTVSTRMIFSKTVAATATGIATVTEVFIAGAAVAGKFFRTILKTVFGTVLRHIFRQQSE